MSDLKLIVESIVTDLVDARFEADVRAGELAELYRDNDSLRALHVPTLNIRNVSIDLKFAFDDTPIEPPPGPSDEQVKAVAAAAELAVPKLLALSAVSRRVTGRSRTTLARSLEGALNSTMIDNVGAAASDRSAAVERAVRDQLSQQGISRLSAADRAAMLNQVVALEKALARAPKPKPTQLPGVIVASEALSKVDPGAVSTIHFEVDLAERRWREVADEDGPRTILTDD